MDKKTHTTKYFAHKYPAQGFVEALVAVAITGIAGIVLLSIATRTVNQTVYNEIQDEITILNNNMERKLEFILQAEENNELGGSSIIADLTAHLNSCVTLNFSLDNPIAYEIADRCTNNLGEDGLLSRDSCGLTEQEDVEKTGFVFVCPTQSSSHALTVDIISGNIACRGSNCRDYVNPEVFLLK